MQPYFKNSLSRQRWVRGFIFGASIGVLLVFATLIHIAGQVRSSAPYADTYAYIGPLQVASIDKIPMPGGGYILKLALHHGIAIWLSLCCIGGILAFEMLARRVRR